MEKKSISLINNSAEAGIKESNILTFKLYQILKPYSSASYILED